LIALESVYGKVSIVETPQSLITAKFSLIQDPPFTPSGRDTVVCPSGAEQLSAVACLRSSPPVVLWPRPPHSNNKWLPRLRTNLDWLDRRRSGTKSSLTCHRRQVRRSASVFGTSANNISPPCSPNFAKKAERARCGGRPTITS